MSNEIMTRTEKRMFATVEDFQHKLSAVRTGRASLGILDRINVDYYGTPTPLNQAAKLSVPEATMIVATPFDPSMLQVIFRGINWTLDTFPAPQVNTGVKLSG